MTKEAFLEKVEKTDFCWNWKKSTTSEGYGNAGPRGEKSHRMAYKIFKGEIPDGLFVCHSCDNRKCVNPGHLFLGTNKQNMEDCSKKDRIAHGTRQRCAKLSPDKVIVAISKRIDGDTYKDIAEHLGVCKETIRDIFHGKTWRRVSGIKLR